MRGLPDYNFPAFIKAGNILRQYGFHVINPAEMDMAAGFFPDSQEEPCIRDCMQRDLFELCLCHAMYLLPGWENSKGTWVELVLAMELGLAIHQIGSVGEVFGYDFLKDLRPLTYKEINERHTRALRHPQPLPKVREPGQPGSLPGRIFKMLQRGLRFLFLSKHITKPSKGASGNQLNLFTN